MRGSKTRHIIGEHYNLVTTAGHNVLYLSGHATAGLGRYWQGQVVGWLEFTACPHFAHIQIRTAKRGKKNIGGDGTGRYF
jgi:hypothetical protein